MRLVAFHSPGSKSESIFPPDGSNRRWSGLDALRADPQLCKIPILLLSACAVEEGVADDLRSFSPQPFGAQTDIWCKIESELARIIQQPGSIR